MKTVGRAEQQMKPDEVPFPAPDQVPDEETSDHQHHIKREEVRRQRDEEVIFCHDYVATGRARLELLYASSKEPGPEHMREFMPEDIDAHRFREQKEDHQPARSAAERGHPHGVSVVSHLEHEPQRLDRSKAKGKEQYRDDQFEPFRHGQVCSRAGARCKSSMIQGGVSAKGML